MFHLTICLNRLFVIVIHENSMLKTKWFSHELLFNYSFTVIIKARHADTVSKIVLADVNTFSSIFSHRISMSV